MSQLHRLGIWYTNVGVFVETSNILLKKQKDRLTERRYGDIGKSWQENR
ncbi:hypothetical protein HMPREF0645_0483 [Hallella bergensis DSM 17361]|uniref:Uncharacterized protein n=1 Tax=Hallella bergensis DSM 17361 TaxID=585502 RepID=D1PU48_9BACT|nr:hypothetical protein HMPREF0645_0483 [Hallella bergensis DSM 17361]